MSSDKLAEIHIQLAEYLGKGWIKPIYIRLGLQSFLSMEKDGTFMMCINYRALNKKTKLGFYPLPNANGILDSFSKFRIFCQI